MAGNSKNAIMKSVLNASATSLAASFSSTPFDIRTLDNIAVQLNATTSNAVGTFSVQGSLDYNPGGSTSPSGPVAGNWIAITLPAIPTLASVDAQFLLDLNQLSFPWLRIAYTRTSGTGTVDIYVSGKAV